MATIKSYTDIEQSKKLAEFLPLESADYYHATDAGVVITTPYITYCGEERCVPAYKGAVPCWSLAALLNILPKYELYNFGNTIQLDVNLEAIVAEGDETFLDLVVNMIIHLYEFKMLCI